MIFFFFFHIFRKKIHVILIHNSNTSETLILCANEHYYFSNLVENLPLRGAFKVSGLCMPIITVFPGYVVHGSIASFLFP